jgi:peptide/nickel transport system substrate-binding protein
MKGKLWLFICFIICSILLVSCSQVQQNTQSNTTTSSITTSTVEKTTKAITSPTTSDKPQYGGQIIIGLSFNVGDFDEIYGFFGPPELNTMQLTNERLFTGDWTKGPAGTGATTWSAIRTQFETGAIAESWDFSRLPQGVMTFKIRQGIHFGLNSDSEASKLVGGRELTADDVVFSLKQGFTNSRSYLYNAYSGLRSANITAPDKYTVTFETIPSQAANALLRATECVDIVPPEVVQKYGNMTDWNNSVGSGPFMLTDFVDSSSVTFVKNPDYWATNQIGTGKDDRLPYVDEVKTLIIPDQSTRQAAFRSGRIDLLNGSSALSWEDGPNMIKAVLGVQYMKGGRNGSQFVTGMRTDQTPFNDIKVRQAMMMATDFDSINKALFGGDALTLTWPIGYWVEYKDAYLGLDDSEMPASVKQLYTYNPDQAKQLLTQAGYPDGFETSIVYNTSDSTVGDYYATLKDQWSKVGIELTLKPTEYVVWTSIYRARSFDHMIQGSYAPVSALYQCTSMSGTTLTNPSYIDDAKVNAASIQMQALSLTDTAKADAIYKDLMKYVLGQAWAIPYPSPPSYTVWQAWLKNYYGSFSVGYMAGPNWTKWAWIDQPLKKSMGH